MGGSQNSLLKNSGAGNGAGNSSGGVATHKGPDEDKVGVLIKHTVCTKVKIKYFVYFNSLKSQGSGDPGAHRVQARRDHGAEEVRRAASRDHL